MKSRASFFVQVPGHPFILELVAVPIWDTWVFNFPIRAQDRLTFNFTLSPITQRKGHLCHTYDGTTWLVGFQKLWSREQKQAPQETSGRETYLLNFLTFTSKSSSHKIHVVSHLALSQSCSLHWTKALPRLLWNTYVTHKGIFLCPSHAWKLSSIVLSYWVATYFSKTAWSPSMLKTTNVSVIT